MILIMAYLCPVKFIRYTSEYNLTNFHFVKEIIGRAILIILQIGAVLLANKIVTNRKSIITQIGINSLAIYILHLFIKDHVINFITFNITNPAIQLMCSLIFTTIVVLILSRDFFTKYLNKFTDGFYDLFFKPVESKFTEK